MEWFKISHYTGINSVIQPMNQVPKEDLVHFLRFIFRGDDPTDQKTTMHSLRSGFRGMLEHFGASEEIICLLGRWSVAHLKTSAQAIYLRPHPREILNWLIEAWKQWYLTRTPEYPFGHSEIEKYYR